MWIQSFDLRDGSPISDPERNLEILTAGFLIPITDQLDEIVALNGFVVAPRHVCGATEVLHPAACSVTTDENDLVRMTVYVIHAGDDELPGLITRMGIFAELLCAATGRVARELTIVVARLTECREAPQFGPIGRVVVCDEIAGQGVQTLLECRPDDVLVEWACRRSARSRLVRRASLG